MKRRFILILIIIACILIVVGTASGVTRLARNYVSSPWINGTSATFDGVDTNLTGNVSADYFILNPVATPTATIPNGTLMFYENPYQYLQVRAFDTWYRLVNTTHVFDHGGLSGLADDDHPHYLTETNATANYILLSNTSIQTDHGSLLGLTDDDHTAYYNLQRHNGTYANLTFNRSGINTLQYYNGSNWITTFNTSVQDHGVLDGLADDDHSTYVDKAGDTMTGNLNIEGVNPRLIFGGGDDPGIAFHIQGSEKAALYLENNTTLALFNNASAGVGDAKIMIRINMSNGDIRKMGRIKVGDGSNEVQGTLKSNATGLYVYDGTTWDILNAY